MEQSVSPQAQSRNDMYDFKTKVEKLSLMKKSGLITEDEFTNMKQELLKSIF